MKNFRMSIDRMKVVMLFDARETAFFLANDFEDHAYLWMSHDEMEVKRRGKFSTGMLNFQEAFTISPPFGKEGVIWMGIAQNEYCRSDFSKKRIMIQWNPNKTALPRFLIMWLSKIGAKYSHVHQLDLAMDFDDVFPHDFRIFSRKETILYGDTKYVKTEGKNGEIRIYDKTLERQLAGDPLDRQVTRVEITLKPPSGFEHSKVFYTPDFAYWEDICNRLGEIYVPTDFHRLVYDVEQEYGHKSNPAVLYMLRQLNEPERKHAFRLMDPKTATFYRKLLCTGDVDRFIMDELVLMEQVIQMTRRIVVPLVEFPEPVESWYDIRKNCENKAKDKYYERESIVSGIYDKIRNSKSAPLDLSRIQGESGSPCDSDPWEP